MKKISKIVVLLGILVFNMFTLCYGETKNNTQNNTKDLTKVVYNTKTLDFGNKNVINKSGTVYIPLRTLSENLYYTVDWFSETNTVKIHDNLNDISLNMNGDVEINGVKSTSEKTPLIVNGSVYVPLRFVSEALDVKVEYNSPTHTVKMTGRDIYEIEQKDLFKPYLIAYTKDGRKNLGLIGDKNKPTGATPYVTDNYKTTILNVARTTYSDIISTSYVVNQSGYYDILYVKDRKIIDKGNWYTRSYDKYTYKPINTYYFDNRVALLKINIDSQDYIKIYDDTTGELINKINPEALVSETLKTTNINHYGRVYNIQAVGEDFVVATLYLPYTLETNLNFRSFYFTAIINTKTNKITPVYEHLSQYDKYNPFDDNGGVAWGFRHTGGIAYFDYVVFDSVTTDGTLKFVFPYYDETDTKKFEWVELEY